MDVTTGIGVLGATIILVFFLLNQVKKIDQDNLIYDLGNLIGSSLLLYYSYLLGSMPFMILNLVWAGFSLRDIIFHKKE